MTRLLPLVLALAVACGTPVAGDQSATATVPAVSKPSVIPTASASPQPGPTHIPGASVHISVNGTTLLQGGTAQLDGDSPAVVVMEFPMSMDRASVERYLPRSGSAVWTDDRTVAFSIPATEAFPAFKVPESMSKDGSTVVDIFFVNLSPVPSLVVSMFSVAELQAGAHAPSDYAVRVPSGAEVLRFSPDTRKVLMLQSRDLPFGKAATRIFDIASRSMTVLPATLNGPLLLGGWLGNDRVVLVGDAIWTVAVDGTDIRTVTDLRGLAPPKTAAVSPLGNYVALASNDQMEVVDLRSGAVRVIAGHHDDCDLPISPLARVAWSPDELRLATLECVASAAMPRVRITEIGSGRVIKTIDGGDMGVVSQLSGDFALPRESGEQGEGARRLFVVYSFDGAEKARYRGYAISTSPNGKYLLDGSCCAGEGSALTDLTAPGQPTVGFAGTAAWLRDGRVVVITRPGGSRSSVVP